MADLAEAGTDGGGFGFWERDGVRRVGVRWIGFGILSCWRGWREGKRNSSGSHGVVLILSSFGI